MPDPSEIERILCCAGTCGRPTVDHQNPCGAPGYGRKRRLALKAAGYRVVPAEPDAHQGAAAIEVDRLRSIIAASVDMIENCAGVPQQPDSLPQMLRQHLRAALTPEPSANG